MGRILKIIRPLALAALFLEAMRILLSVAGHHQWASLFSLTGLQIVACVYLPYRVVRGESLGLGHLWVCLTALFLFSQTVFSIATATAYVLGHLEATSSGIDGEAAQPELLSHLFFHLKLWVVFLPALATGLLGWPMLLWARRRGWRGPDTAVSTE